MKEEGTGQAGWVSRGSVLAHCQMADAMAVSHLVFNL
jgi:hypothetical protein